MRGYPLGTCSGGPETLKEAWKGYNGMSQYRTGLPILRVSALRLPGFTRRWVELIDVAYSYQQLVRDGSWWKGNVENLGSVKRVVGHRFRPHPAASDQPMAYDQHAIDKSPPLLAYNCSVISNVL